MRAWYLQVPAEPTSLPILGSVLAARLQYELLSRGTQMRPPAEDVKGERNPLQNATRACRPTKGTPPSWCYHTTLNHSLDFTQVIYMACVTHLCW